MTDLQSCNPAINGDGPPGSGKLSESI